MSVFGKKFSALGLIAGLGFGCFGVSASAATCSGVILSGVTPHIGCEIGSVNNDSAAQLDQDAVFGLTGWSQIAKDDGPDGTIDSGNGLLFSTSGGAQSGTLTISEFVFSTFSSVVVVLKSAAGNALPDDYVAFKVESAGAPSSTFSYDTVFVNVQGGGAGNPKDISHISLYGQGTPEISPVPLPATAWLFVTGLLGLVGLRRRKS